MVGTRVQEASKAPASPALSQLVGGLGADASLRVFLNPSFKPESHVGQAVREDRVAVALEDAQRASSLLTANVRQEVIRRKEALLAEVEAVDALEKEVSTVSTGVAGLTAATSALADALQAPFVPMTAAVSRMRNLTAAADLLSALQRFRLCTERLSDAGLFPTIGPASATTPHNLPPAAAAIRELEELTGPSGAAGLDKVEGVAKDIIAVRKASHELRKRAAAILKGGLSARTQIDVEAAVMAFNSLNVLHDRVNTEMARLSRETQSAVHRGLEAPASANLPSRGATLRVLPGIGGSAPAPGTADVWANVEKMLSTVAESCFKAILLQQVLSKKYCDVTHMSLLHDTVASNFIDAVSKTMAEQVAIMSRTRMQRPTAAYVFSALAEGYPKLKSSLTDLASRVSALARVLPIPITELSPTAKLPLIPDHDFIQKSFFLAFQEVETHYLTASLERLTATVSSFYDGGKHAGETEALTLTKSLAAELSVARGDKQLFHTAVNNVSTALRLYASQAEDYAAATAPDEDFNGKVLGELEEWRLTGLYNGIISLSVSAGRVLGEREDGSGRIPTTIQKELTMLRRFGDLLLDGPFSTCRQNLRTVLKRMHSENLAGEVGEDGCSVYVLDITAQLSMFADGIIPGLARSRSLGKYTLDLAKWVLDSFVDNVSLVFPQSDAAKMRLSTDMARIELAVESLCPARLLGASFQSLRALRTAILLPTEAFKAVDDELFEQVRVLKPSTFAHLLLGRSSEDTMRHPHRRQGMSVDEYITWLESHSEEEAWSPIEEVLEEYRKGCESSEIPPLPEYHVIRAVCEKLRSPEE